jgi:hypothetical protein
MSTNDYDDYPPDPEPKFEWSDSDEEPPPRRRERGRPRRKKRGGGFSVPPPSARLLGLLVAAVVLVVVIALVVRDCQRDQLVDSYKTYVADSSVIIDTSAKHGEQLRTVLNNQQGRGAQQLQTQVRQLANQSQQLVEQSQDLDPPGKMDAAHQSLITVMEFRTNGLSALADDLPQIIRSEQQAFSATQLAGHMQRFLASDVIYDDSFVGPAKIALEEDDIVDVEIPEGDNVHFLPGNTTVFASPVGAARLVPNLKGGGGGGDSDASGQDDEQTGTLRGLGLISVEALPSGAALSTSQETSVGQDGLVWKITVENGGDFDESNIAVTAELAYPDNPGDTITAERSIDAIASKEQQVVEIPLSGNPRLGESGILTVSVQPVAGETSTENNRAAYPVKITFE